MSLILLDFEMSLLQAPLSTSVSGEAKTKDVYPEVERIKKKAGGVRLAY